MITDNPEEAQNVVAKSIFQKYRRQWSSLVLETSKICSQSQVIECQSFLQNDT